MKILLTGANGFVGSHILDSLRQRGFPVRLLLRPTSDTRFIEPRLPEVEVCSGALSEPEILRKALEGVTHVIHCAGLTRARKSGEFHAVNCGLTQALVAAVNERQATVQRFLHISSLAASHPAPLHAPAREEDPTQPVSEYGKSKLAAERAVVEGCRVPFTILRPPAVYGPRDNAFLFFFQLAKARLVPQFLGGVQHLSMVLAKDLAEAAATCLDHPRTAGRTYFVASPEVLTPSEFGREIARHMQVRTMVLPFPVPLLWPICIVSEGLARLTGHAAMLNRQKYADLSAPGWVCDSSRLRQETGFVASTPLREGIAQTLAWYRQAGCI